MAKSQGRRGGGGGVKGQLVSGLVLVVLAGAIMGWWRSNGFTSPADLVNYSRAWSDKVGGCYKNGEQLWNCDTSLNAPTPSEPSVSPSAPGSAVPGTSAPSALTVAPDSDKASLLGVLDTIKTNDPLPEGYSTSFVASEWPYWTNYPCDARQATLKKNGTGVGFKQGSDCVVEKGSWTEPFTGQVITSPAAVDVTHAVTPQYAADHGGKDWKPERKQLFANDLSNLLIIAPEERVARGVMDPAEYMPKDRGFQCTYAKTWVSVSHNYDLTLSQAAKYALRDGLQKC